jgi:branched-chain amino acid transport system substrate-binding protein
MVVITQAGTNQLDHVQFPYLWRDFQPDTVNSVAMAAYALSHGYRRAALMIGQNGGSQSVVPTLVKSFTGHGGRVVSNEQLPLDQSSYQSELTKMLSSHPDVIFTETDPQSAATMFSELKGMNGLSIPVIGTSATAIGPYWSTVSKAVGGIGEMNKFFTDITPPSTGSGPGYNTFLKFYRRANPGVPTNVYVAGNYDCIVIMALAMDMANSTKPSVYVKDIPKVVDNHSAPAVATYAAGLAAIKAHKAFYYAGALGPVSFNQYHSITGLSVAQKSASSGNSFVTVEKLSNDLVAKYQ